MTEYATPLNDSLVSKVPTPSLAKKMALIMGDLEYIPKNGWNPHFKFKYAAAEDVASAIRNGLAKHGVAFFAAMHAPQPFGERAFLIQFTFSFVCTDTGEMQSCEWYAIEEHTTSNGKFDNKALHKAATGAQKYFLLRTFVASTGDDPDPDADADKTPPQNVTKFPSSKPQPQTDGSSALAPQPETFVAPINQAKVFRTKKNGTGIELTVQGSQGTKTVTIWSRQPFRDAGYEAAVANMELPDDEDSKIVEFRDVKGEFRLKGQTLELVSIVSAHAEPKVAPRKEGRLS